MANRRSLIINRAREHNLKDISLTIPHDSFTVITGLSGSGKSSLAFDTIYAEGQRRYLETFSPYIRQFFDKVKKPAVESVDNVRPTIAIQQRTRVVNSRSTVGSMTGILDYLRTIWNALAQPVCGTCGISLEQWSPSELAKRIGSIVSLFPEHTFLIAAPITIPKKKGALKGEIARLALLGFSRILIPHSGSIVRIDREGAVSEIGNIEEFLVVLDRFSAESFDSSRIREGVDQAFTLAQGGCSLVRLSSPDSNRRRLATIGHEGEARSQIGVQYDRSDFWERPRCARSTASLQRPRPALFSFNHPLGACPTCKGFGSVLVTDLEKCIPNPNLSLSQGCIACWSGESSASERRSLATFCSQRGIPMNVPWSALSEAHRSEIISSKTKQYWGIEPWFSWLEKKSYKMHVRVFLTRYRKQAVCNSCNGRRLKNDALGYLIDGLTIADIWAKPVSEITEWLSVLQKKCASAGPVPREVQEVFRATESRLRFLIDLGLPYLTLDRQARTLSGGETQRVNLAGALGSGLTSTHFVLDEPSVGLHPRDSERLLASLKTLHSQGNTVTVVEHDPLIISAADDIIELGPKGGSEGGSIIYHGPASEWSGIDFSPPPRSAPPKTKKQEYLVVKNGAARNITGLSVSLPLGRFICITGVSGCGKSTFVQEILAKEYERHSLGLAPINLVEGYNQIRQLLIVDQSPLSKTPRANVATYSKIWEPIRSLLANTDDARSRALTKSSFSFNVPGGRCLQCEGSGFIREDMQFLSDVYIECEGCLGKRFQPSVLEVSWRGRSVDDILQTSVDDAVSLFGDINGIKKPLEIISSLGLGHLTLGHSLSELSGGEAQRLKLVPLISGAEEDRALVIFDEPTTGLHVRDLFRLVSVCRQLRDAGHTVLAVEHNLSFINEADWVVDMGPEGGKDGGRVVFCGTPEELAESESGHTSRYLKQYRDESERGVATVPTVPPVEREEARYIKIRGAREHNLREIDLDIPLGKTVALTGVSGSGKSTIARDILFAEGQRRYLDCLSPYAQQFIQQIKRPDLEHLENIPPSIYVSQHLSRPGPLSTLGTLTEVYNFLRLLYVKLGTQFCVNHPDQQIEGGSLSDMISFVRRFPSSELRILAPVISKKKGNHKAVFERAQNSEIREVRVDGIFQKTSSVLEGLEKSKVHSIDFVIGKINPVRTDDEMIGSALSLALSVGNGQAIVVSSLGDSVLSSSRMCPICKTGYLKLDPEDLSFHSRRGQCCDCGGLGVSKSEQICPSCNGTRLNAIGNSVQLQGLSLGNLASRNARDISHHISSLTLSNYQKTLAEPIISEISSRLNHLIALGLGSIPLSRSSNSVSGGELQRLRLAAAMGSPLSGVLYIFDEPSAGLHPSDNRLVINQIEKVRDAGNTVVVIEHDSETIQACEHLIAVGPGGGKEGGSIVFDGSMPAAGGGIVNDPAIFEVHAPTQEYVAIADSEECGLLHVTGSSRTINDIDLHIPLTQLVVIAGVSGAGKSTLLHEMIGATIAEGKKKKSTYVRGDCSITLPDEISRVVTIDQTPIGTNSRSTPASYLKIWDEIRKLFATTIEAKTLGWKVGDFSFNTGKGRCAECKGLGTITLEMNFLADASMVCESCGGKRFIDDLHHIRFQGRSITEVLGLTFGDARDLFRAHTKIHRALALACDLGLDYLSIGQCSSTLSGGEAQRIKLVQELAQQRISKTLYLLDEPTIGLHRADVARLMATLRSLVGRGHSVIVIEHDRDVVCAADYLIELGPGAGEDGGKIVFAGKAQDLPRSDTAWGRELRRGV